MADDDQSQLVGDNIRGLLVTVQKAFVIEATGQLIRRCPVKTGHARANFIPGIGPPGATVAPGADQSPQAAGIAQVAAYSADSGLVEMSISNHVPYIDRLFGGWSSQAPAGWDLEAIDAAAKIVAADYVDVQIDVTRDASGYSAKIVRIAAAGVTGPPTTVR